MELRAYAVPRVLPYDAEARSLGYLLDGTGNIDYPDAGPDDLQGCLEGLLRYLDQPPGLGLQRPIPTVMAASPA